MSQSSREILAPSTTPALSTVSGVSSVASGIVRALLSPRETFLNSRAPTLSGVHQWRRDVGCGKIRFAHQLLRSNFADIDDGIPVDAVNQYARDLIEANTQYAARKAKGERAGVLPFGERFLRAVVAETEAENQGNVATQVAECRPTDLAALRIARDKLTAEMEPTLRLIDTITSQIVALEMAGET